MQRHDKPYQKLWSKILISISGSTFHGTPKAALTFHSRPRAESTTMSAMEEKKQVNSETVPEDVQIGGVFDEDE